MNKLNVQTSKKLWNVTILVNIFISFRSLVVFEVKLKRRHTNKSQLRSIIKPFLIKLFADKGLSANK